MATAEKPVKLTVDLGDREIYRAIRHAAIERDQPLREIVVEALREWLERYEEQEDLAAMAQAEGDHTFPWEQVKAQIDAHSAGSQADRIHVKCTSLSSLVRHGRTWRRKS